MTISIIEPVGGHGAMDYYDYGLAQGLAENGVNVLLYTSDETTVRTYKNVQSKLIFKGLWASPFLKKTWLYMKGHGVAYADSRKNKVKIVHLHFFYFRGIDLVILLMAKFYGLKSVVTVHDVNSFHRHSLKFIEKLCYRLINGVIVHNYTSRDIIKEKSVKLRELSVIPHGNYLPFISVNRKTIPPSDQFTILFFGQIKKVKGVDVLLKGISHVTAVNKKIRLLIAGRPWKYDLTNYENMIAELGLSAFVETDFRYVPDEEVACFFERADLVVLPYTEIYQSGVLLLSMSYGKPLLCSDLKPFKEVIKDNENGFLFKSQDDQDLADKLLKIMKDPQLLTKVSENASKQIRKDFDWGDIGRKTLELYNKIH